MSYDLYTWLRTGVQILLALIPKILKLEVARTLLVIVTLNFASTESGNFFFF